MNVYPSASAKTFFSFNYLSSQTFFLYLLLIFILLIYLATMPPSVYWGDGTELTTAAYFLGIPHPPGYPLYSLLGKLFTLLPFGNIAWRLHLSSVFYTICASIIFFFLLRLISLNLFPPGFFPTEIYRNSIIFSFTLAFSFSRTMWRLGTVAEVYALFILFLVGIIYMVFFYFFTKQRRYLFLLIFFFALSITHHFMTLIALPFLLLVVLDFFFYSDKEIYRQRKLSLLLRMFVLAILPFSIFIYLPIRAGAYPPVNWGFPANLKNLIWVISGGDFKKYYFLQFPPGQLLNGETISPFITLRLNSIYHWVVSEFYDLSGAEIWAKATFIFLLSFVCGSGLLYLLLRHLSLALALLWNLLLVFLVVFLYGIYDIEDYFVSLLPGFFIIFFVGLMVLQNILEKHLFRRKLGYLNWLYLALALVILTGNFKANDRHKDFIAENYARRIFGFLPQNSIIITAGDNDIFPLWYFQYVEGFRPDVLVLGGNFIYSPWYQEFFRNVDLRGRKIHLEKRPIFTEESYCNDLSRWIIEPNISNFSIFTTESLPYLGWLYEVKAVATLLTPAEYQQTRARFLPPPFLYKISPKPQGAEQSKKQNLLPAKSLLTNNNFPPDLKTERKMKRGKRFIVIYTDKYLVDIGPHVFPTQKYLLIKNKLLEEGLITKDDIVEPEPPTREQLLLVHTAEYLDDLFNLRWTPRTMRSELPISREIVDAYVLCAGGSIKATEFAAKNKGCGIHIGGGFHHAFPGHAEGFCYINDIAVAIRVAQKEGWIRRAFVVDCDLHQGNGTAVIFHDDPEVFTFSIHQENNYPVKEKSDLDIGLPDFADDELYLQELGKVVPKKLDEFKPDLVFYVAGADPYKQDQLGGLSLTKDGLRLRDEMVIQYCAEKQIPLVIVLAGGYAYDLTDTVSIQSTTCSLAIKKFY